MTVRSAPSRTVGPIYYWQEGVENLERYCVGGYHPIQLGDEFSHRRYRVIHKLGYGSFSTVWLAKDQKDKRYVSLKVITSAASGSSSEAKIRHCLREGNPEHPGRNFVLSSLDDFWIDGPNGRHQCLVSEVVGSTIIEVREATKYGVLPLKIARGIATPLALGLAYIHSCGVLHGGQNSFFSLHVRQASAAFGLIAHRVPDLHGGNISFEVPGLDSWNDEQIREHFGEPSMNMVSRLDDKPVGPEVPPYTVEPAYISGPVEEGLTRCIKIIDFGEASFSKEERKKLHTPILLQPPELFFDENIGLSADIWALACTIFDIFGKHSLFQAFMPDKDIVLLEMVSTLGMLPDRWWKNWENRGQYFSSDGTRKADSMISYPQEPRPLALRIQQMRLGRGEREESASEQLNAKDIANLQNLLLSMLRYEPSERATAEEVAKFEWAQQALQGP